MVFNNLLHWKVTGKYNIVNLIFDSLSFLKLQKLSFLLARKLGFSMTQKFIILILQN